MEGSQTRFICARTPQWEIRMRGVESAMGEAEKRVAAYIRERGFDVLRMTIAEISNATNVSDATVVRFCRRLNYQGLKDFKIALAQERPAENGVVSERIDWGDSVAKAKQKVFAGAVHALEDSVRLLDDGQLERAVDVLYKAKHIDIYGLGGSVPIASYMRHQFMKLGIRTNLYTDAQSQHLSMAQFTREDVALAISCSGDTPEIVSALTWAHHQGCTTIAITNHAGSPLGQVSDIKLITTGGVFFQEGKNTLSRFAQLAVVNALYAGVALTMGRKGVEDILKKNREARYLAGE